MFTQQVQRIIDEAKDYAFSDGEGELSVRALLLAVRADTEAGALLGECVGTGLAVLRDRLPCVPEPVPCPGALPLSPAVRGVMEHAKDLADELPDPLHPGLIDLRHLAAALAMSREACARIDVVPTSRKDAMVLLACWQQGQVETPSLGELTTRTRSMRDGLLTRVFGQDHAVDAFVEGLFNAEVVAAADRQRKAPKAIFVFAGPPGVGKTFLAEQGSALLDRPFKRFDMSAYSGSQQNERLVGMAKAYRDAHPGLLTEFVEKNPDALLLFDEIEKAHPNTIHLFLQILDAGTLEDKYHEREVSFRNAVVIFTTNAGKRLYDRPNESGVHAANAAFHRRTVLDALATEKDPATGRTFFPGPICSRLATGYPVLFNHLGINELERVVRTELRRVLVLLERQYYMLAEFDEDLPLVIVLREGGRTDARTLRSQAESFAKTELLRFCQMFEEERLEAVLSGVDTVRFGLADDFTHATPDVAALFHPPDRPRVLLVADAGLAELCNGSTDAVEWLHASTPEPALQALAEEDVDLVLLDLRLDPPGTNPGDTTPAQPLDGPGPAGRLDLGQEILRRIRERLPRLPVYLLSLRRRGRSGGNTQLGADDELFEACVRAGGARGILTSTFVEGMSTGWEEDRNRFVTRLLDICRHLHREKAAAGLAQEHKVLSFETVAWLDDLRHEVAIQIRNPRLGRAIAAADAGEILEEVERPRTTFSDVIGATSAKEELQFFVDYLRNPRRFAALGLKPPKGVLLYGPPGTGKTMLARAMAGETSIAFLPVSATSFVTVWQGSGPQNVRDLFARARRYAPAIIFIDEIDAIGRTRTGLGGVGQAEENALNALLTEMDGFANPSLDRPIFLLAATNFQVGGGASGRAARESRELDPALVRRFSRAVAVVRPDTAARKLYLSRRLDGDKHISVSKEAIELLAEKSVGMGIADLEHVVEAAGRRALQRGGVIDDEALVEAFDTVREGAPKEWDPKLLEVVARHEAGHTVMYWLSGWWATQVDIVARAEHGGGMLPCEAETQQQLLTREEFLARRVRTSLGGRAAEILCYGPEQGLSTGAWGDLEKASNDARKMVCLYGMDEEFGILSVGDVLRHPEAQSGPTYERVNEAASKILEREMAKTIGLLERHRQYLDDVSSALLRRNRLYRHDLRELLPDLQSAAR